MITHQIRMKDGGTKIVKLTPLKSIRFFCRNECMEYRPSLVRKCNSKLCPLYPYRLGRDSERKGIGGGFSLAGHVEHAGRD